MRACVMFGVDIRLAIGGLAEEKRKQARRNKTEQTKSIYLPDLPAAGLRVFSLGTYEVIVSREAGGHPLAVYSRRSKRIFHSRRRALAAVGIQSWELMATKRGPT